MFYSLSCSFMSDENAEKGFSIIGTSEARLCEIAQEVADTEHEAIRAELYIADSWSLHHDTDHKELDLFAISHDSEEVLRKKIIKPRN